MSIQLDPREDDASEERTLRCCRSGTKDVRSCGLQRTMSKRGFRSIHLCLYKLTMVGICELCVFQKTHLRGMKCRWGCLTFPNAVTLLPCRCCATICDGDTDSRCPVTRIVEFLDVLVSEKLYRIRVRGCGMTLVSKLTNSRLRSLQMDAAQCFGWRLAVYTC